MIGIMSDIIKSLKQLFNKKGQGIVEFALLCAFCAAIGLFARDAGFSEAFDSSLEKSKDDLYWAEIKQRTRSSYISYFKDWRWKSSAELRNPDTREERIQADQKALVIIAEAFLGKNENQVFSLMNYFSNSPDNNSEPHYINNLKCIDDNGDGTGFSNILVPLSYQWNKLNGHTTLDKNQGWLWLDANNNQNTVLYLTDKLGEVYDKFATNNPTYNTSHSQLKTVTTDRLFYSDDMLDSAGKVKLRLHYTNGRVDFVDIALGKGDADWKCKNNSEPIAERLCLHVVESGYSEIPLKNNKNAVNNYTDFYDSSYN